MARRRGVGKRTPGEMPSVGDATATATPPRSFTKELLQRLLIAAFCIGGGYALWDMGRHILRTGEYNYTLETSNGERGAHRRVTRETVHATGDWAREQAAGFQAAGATLAYWGVLMLLGSSGPFTNPLVWTPSRLAMLAVSLAGCLAAVIAFFPPWRIGRSMSSNAFYIVIACCLYLGTIRDRSRLKAHSLKVFPALICSAVVIGDFSSGYAVGIILGIFAALVLAFHILMLIPAARAELMKPE